MNIRQTTNSPAADRAATETSAQCRAGAITAGSGVSSPTGVPARGVTATSEPEPSESAELELSERELDTARNVWAVESGPNPY